MPRNDDIYEYEYWNKKFKKNAITSMLDMLMERNLNDLDFERSMSENCIDRVLFQIQKYTLMKDLPRLSLENHTISELMEVLEKFQTVFEKRLFVSLSYYPHIDKGSMNSLICKVKSDEVVIMVGRDHVFACSAYSLI